MVRSSMHMRLRDSTAAAHTQLESLVGELKSIDLYKRYLAGIYAFRQPIEAAWATAEWPKPFGGFRPTMISAAMEADMADLAMAPPTDRQKYSDTGFSSRLGTLYVLEGSSLGAKLILRDVRTLGLGGEFGARHLALQANSDSWRAFMRLLDDDHDADPDAVVAAANETFAVAARSFT